MRFYLLVQTLLYTNTDVELTYRGQVFLVLANAIIDELQRQIVFQNSFHSDQYCFFIKLHITTGKSNS